MKRKKERRQYQRPYQYDPPRVHLIVALEARHAQQLINWAFEENRSTSSLIAELLAPVFEEMDRERKRRRK